MIFPVVPTVDRRLDVRHTQISGPCLLENQTAKYKAAKGRQRHCQPVLAVNISESGGLGEGREDLETCTSLPIL